MSIKSGEVLQKYWSDQKNDVGVKTSVDWLSCIGSQGGNINKMPHKHC